MSRSLLLKSLLFVSGLTLLLWHRILNLSFLGESAVYFQSEYVKFIQDGFSHFWNRHDVFALLFFYFLGNILKDSMSAYHFLLFVMTVLVNYSVYLLVQKLTTSHKAAVFSTILFVANYNGSFELLGTGFNYPTFLQRVVTLPIVLISFYLLHNGRFILPLILYTSALFLAHFNLVLLPLFLIYIFISFFPKFIKSAVHSLPYVGISYLLIKNQTITGASSIYWSTLFQDVLHVFNLVTWPKAVILTCQYFYLFLRLCLCFYISIVQHSYTDLIPTDISMYPLCWFPFS